MHLLQSGIDGTLKIHFSYLFYIILVLVGSGLKHIQAKQCHAISRQSHMLRYNKYSMVSNSSAALEVASRSLTR
jgi:hypothetical protein